VIDGKWKSVLNENKINTALNLIYDKLLYIINALQLKKKSVSKNKRLKKWITAGILCSSCQKNELSLKSKNDPLNKNLLNYFKKYRNI